MTLRAAEKMVREFEDRKEELEKRMEMREGVERARKKLMEKTKASGAGKSTFENG